MAKINDVKAYWREQAVKAGLAAEKLQQAEELWNDPAYQKVFTDGFKPLPDYSSDLDSVRDRAKADKDAEYKAWFDNEQRKYQEYLAGLEQLKQYRERFGDLSSNGNGGNNGNNGEPQYLTKEQMEAELERKLNERLSSRDSAYLDYLEVREDHLTKFKSPLDKSKFEEFWKAHPEYGNMRTAYREFVEPEVQKQREAEVNAKLEARYNEGLRDGASRKVIPSDGTPKTFSPLMDRKADVAKLSDSEQESHSRSSFFAALNNPAEDTKK